MVSQALTRSLQLSPAVLEYRHTNMLLWFQSLCG